MDRDFTDTLTDLSNGEVHNQLTDDLRALVEAVVKTKKKGTLTLKIDVKCEGDQAVVKAEITSRPPKPATESTVFFVGKDGSLLRDNPRQQPLKGVPSAPATLRTVQLPAPPPAIAEGKE